MCSNYTDASFPVYQRFWVTLRQVGLQKRLGTISEAFGRTLTLDLDGPPPSDLGLAELVALAPPKAELPPDPEDLASPVRDPPSERKSPPEPRGIGS